MKDYFKIENKGIRIRHSADNTLTEQMLRPFGLPFGDLTENAVYTAENSKIANEIKKKIQLEIDRVGGNEKHFTTGEWKNVEVELYYNIMEATKVDFFYFVKNTYLKNVTITKEWYERNQIEKGLYLKLENLNDFTIAPLNTQIYISENKSVNPIVIVSVDKTNVVYKLKYSEIGYERILPIKSDAYFFCVAK